MATSEEPIPSLKDLASSEPRLRRQSQETIYSHLLSRSTPLSLTQCLHLWRGFFVTLYMHDSKSAISVQNLIAKLASQFTVLAERDAEGELSNFTEAFWETMSREWSGIDVHRMNKILLLIRMVVRTLFTLCVTNPSILNQQLALFEKWPLSLRERNVPDGLRYHVLDVWVDELSQQDMEGEGKQEKVKRMMEPVEELSKGALSKGVRIRAKETMVDGRERLDGAGGGEGT